MPTNAVSELDKFRSAFSSVNPLSLRGSSTCGTNHRTFIHEVGFQAASGAVAVFDPFVDENDPDVGELRYVAYV